MRDGDILDGVMCVDVQIACCLHREIEQAVHGDVVQHVVEEADPRGNLGLTRAVQIERQLDACFPGLAGNSGFSVGHGVSSVWFSC